MLLCWITPGWVQRFIIVPSQLNCIVASGHLVDDQLLEVVELVVPLVQGLVPGAALASPLQLQHARHLQQHIALELQTINRRICIIMEKAPTRAFCWFTLPLKDK